jgi:peptidoglycan/LPS O-acetylase OafA/YrhL
MHALSLPTWVIHISSVVEWMVAIWLLWQTDRLRVLAGGMIPALIGALCACIWHLFDNDPALAWLVTLQATMTLVGNCTLALAAYRIYHDRWQVEKKG